MARRARVILAPLAAVSRLRAILCALVLGATAAPAAAQSASDTAATALPAPGERVRLAFRRNSVWDRTVTITGSLERLTPDTVYIKPEPNAEGFRVPRDKGRLYVSQGRSKWKSGMVFALRGAVVGAYVGQIAFDLDVAADSRRRAIVGGAVLGGAFGLLRGTIAPPERWKRVPDAAAR